MGFYAIIKNINVDVYSCIGWGSLEHSTEDIHICWDGERDYK